MSARPETHIVFLRWQENRGFCHHLWDWHPRARSYEHANLSRERPDAWPIPDGHTHTQTRMIPENNCLSDPSSEQTVHLRMHAEKKGAQVRSGHGTYSSYRYTYSANSRPSKQNKTKTHPCHIGHIIGGTPACHDIRGTKGLLQVVGRFGNLPTHFAIQSQIQERIKFICRRTVAALERAQDRK